MCVCLFVCVCVPVHTYTDKQTHTHTHKRTHTHTHTHKHTQTLVTGKQWPVLFFMAKKKSTAKIVGVFEAHETRDGEVVV